MKIKTKNQPQTLSMYNKRQVDILLSPVNSKTGMKLNVHNGKKIVTHANFHPLHRILFFKTVFY